MPVFCLSFAGEGRDEIVDLVTFCGVAGQDDGIGAGWACHLGFIRSDKNTHHFHISITTQGIDKTAILHPPPPCLAPPPTMAST